MPDDGEGPLPSGEEFLKTVDLDTREGREKLGRYLEAIGQEVAREAVARQHALGYPAYEGDDDGYVYAIYPDGRRERLGPEDCPD